MVESSVREMVIDIERLIENLEPPMSGDCCIYRVPHNLRKVMTEDAYTPYAVSIGPLHHGRKELEPMEKQKLRYLGEFKTHIRLDFDHAVWIIKGMERSVRNYYSEKILINSDEFVKMILTDAAFIIIHLVKSHSKANQHDEFPYRNSCLMSSICQDLMLLENQLPLFVLEKLSFHLTSDLTQWSPLKSKLLYSASELCGAGVTIKARSRDFLLGCEFHSNDAALEIAPLELNNLTTCLLQNLMALELCHYPGKTYICDYISLMGYLMEASKDVELLVQKEILDNGLGDSNEVATFVKKLGTHITVDPRYKCYNNLFTSLNRHC
ncbi:uncharacterized protein LOC123194202 [Mangifera indica]|uniref:uncharacterized protein LOC123194202 n=1 Tax=Mangifera indica TaxID=29780 RepID=UPI001CFBD492|nr:uncharacterized protein LOC123194202 [Mangifera indica]